MPVVKRIVCLANSRKLSHRCVAGKEVEGAAKGAWIRPVSTREHGELTLMDRRYANGQDPRVMDVMDVALQGHAPKGCQQENYLVDSSEPPVRIRRASWAELHTLADPQDSLWVNGQSTARGMNDVISIDVAETLDSSLRLIRVPTLEISVFTYWNKKRVQGRFEHAGTNYWLWVTDPVYETRFMAGPEGDFTIGESYLTISVGEPFKEKNACYKLIAAIIEQGQRGAA